MFPVNFFVCFSASPVERGRVLICSGLVRENLDRLTKEVAVRLLCYEVPIFLSIGDGDTSAGERES